MTYRTVSYTPKGEAAEAIWQHCKYPTWDGLQHNPQTLIRTALLDADVIEGVQTELADRSYWRPGESIRTSLWEENAAALADFAEEHGTTKQKVIESVVMDYINTNQTQQPTA